MYLIMLCSIIAAYVFIQRVDLDLSGHRLGVQGRVVPIYFQRALGWVKHLSC